LKAAIMAFLPGIFGPKEAPVAAHAAAPVAAPPAGNSATNPATQQPAGQPAPGNNAAAQQQPANSNLDALMKLMTPTAEVIAARARQQEDMNKGIFPEIKPEQIQQSLSNADFTTGLQPEQIQKALAGDAQALMHIMNITARNAVASSMQISQGLVEQGVKTGNERFNSSLDSRFRDLQLRNQNTSNPALQHPLARGMIDSIKSQIANANPRLSPSEVAQQAETHFLQFAKDLAAPTPAQADANKPPEKDWLRYLEDGSVGSSAAGPQT
jgi:hypothetical protein